MFWIAISIIMAGYLIAQAIKKSNERRNNNPGDLEQGSLNTGNKTYQEENYQNDLSMIDTEA